MKLAPINKDSESSRNANYGGKWSGTVERNGNEEEFNLNELTIGEDGKMKGYGSDEAGDFKFEGMTKVGIVNCSQTYTNKKVIFYEGKINKEMNELTGQWGMELGGKDGEFRLYKV